MPNSASFNLTVAVKAEALAKEATSPGSGTTWLTDLRTAIIESALDRESPLITSTSINGKADAFLHEYTDEDRLGAIQAALDAINEVAAPRRVTYPNFQRCNFGN